SDKIGVLGKNTYAYNLVKAIVFHEEGNYKNAETHYQTALERNTQGDERVFYHYGMLLYDQQKYSLASKNLEKAYKVSPRTYKYLQDYVESLEKEKRWKEVISLLEGSDFREKPMFRSYVSLSNAFLAIKKYDESLNNINRAIDLNSGSSFLHYLKSKVLYSMGKYADAETEINKAVVLDMRNFENYMMFARILIKRGDFKGAIEKIEAAENIDNKDESLMLLKGIVYKNLDDYRNALVYFRRVKSPVLRKEAYLEIGETYMQVNNTKEALKYFRLAEKNGNPNAHKYLAKIYYEMGKIDTAIQYYRKSLRVDKNDVRALRQLGYIYKEKGEYPRSIAYFNRYLKLITDHHEKEMIRDEIFFLNRNMTEAQKSRIVEDDTLEMDEEEINERAKELYLEGRALRIEDPELAREKFREVMKMVPKDNEYYQKSFRSFNRLNKENQ
ncbi:MAG TPA: tetratricopeptide repeat protein, partial [bacterium]|nr:tetratricopeptide repeat protein [bacterium]